MDYKVLLDKLRGFIYWSEEHYHYIHPAIFDEAATAIETLLAERKVLLESIHGDCDECVESKTSPTCPPCNWCCYNLNHHRSTPSADNWKWRGPTPTDLEEKGG